MQNPTKREVFAADFRDRIVHHLLCDYLEPRFEKFFIPQSYACRKEKGTHQAVKKAVKFLKILPRQKARLYFAHLDIKGFFMSLKKDILFSIIKKKIKNPQVLWLTKTIIFHDPTQNFFQKSPQSFFDQLPNHKSLFRIPAGQGLPIGNLTSQFFANVYLDQLDQFVKRKLKIRFYLRYVDDFLIFSENKRALSLWGDQINFFLKTELGIELNQNKTKIDLVKNGFDWLGYRIFPEKILVRPRVLKALRKKINQFNQLLEKYPPTITPTGQTKMIFADQTPKIEILEKMLATLNSYFGHLCHAHSLKIKKCLWQKDFQRLKNYFEPNDEKFSSFRLIEFFHRLKKSSASIAERTHRT